MERRLYPLLSDPCDKSGNRSCIGIAGDSSVAENWLEYGRACESCLGPLMVIEKSRSWHIAFCVDAIFMPVGSGKGTEQYEKVYLGFGGKDQAAAWACMLLQRRILRAFRLPAGYRPCREHGKLECSFWVEQYRQKKVGGNGIPVAV